MSSQLPPSPGTPQPSDILVTRTREPIRVTIEPPRYSWIGTGLKWIVGLLFILFLIGSMDSSYYDRGARSKVEEHYHSLNKSATDKVAIIAIEGTILGEDGFVKHQIDHVRDDDHVRAIVVRVDSPGGTVTGSDYIYHHLKALAADRGIPMVVSMGGIAASGGYYVSMAVGDTENTIFAEPTTWTGSIGVIIPHYDLSGLLEKISVQDDSIASNPLKMMGSPTRKFPEPIRAEEQAILKGLVDSSFEGFKEIVLAGRSALRADQAAQEVVFTGRIFTAKQAKEQHLVDKLGFVEDAIDRAIELAGLAKSDVKVVKYRKQTGVLEQALFGSESRQQRLDLSALLELTVPKAYYLCTWLPGLGPSAHP